MFEELTENRNAWLATGNNHGWWNHGARDVPLPKKLIISKAPGWGSLLPETVHGVDAGLQCPMCSAANKKDAPRY